jgi:uncharacterized membrane protein HdeD (DUF308 family)
MNQFNDVQPRLFPELAAELHRNWGWLLVMGIALLILGILALLDSIFATAISMIFFGWILVIAGIVEGVQTFRHRSGHHLFLHLLNAALSIVVGALLLWRPLAGAVVMTLLLAMYFTVAGIFRIVAAASVRVPGWGWTLFNGIVSLLLGILIWVHWPVSGLWVIGLFIGIDLIIVGWSQIMTAAAVRSI